MAAAGGDVDGDGYSDMVVAHETNPNVVVQFRDPSVINDVLFLPNRVTYPLQGPPRQVILQDLNGDARPEMIVLLSNSLIEVFRNTGQSGSALFDAPQLLYTGADPVYLRIADINADGQPDFAVACPGDDTVNLFYNQSVVLAAKASRSQLTVTVYPNPARTMLHLQMSPGTLVGKATLLDALGRPMRAWPKPAAALDISDLPRGIYLLQVEAQNSLFTRRVILD